MSSSQPPEGGPAGRLPGDSLGDPLAPPVEINGRSSDRGDSVDAPERNLDAEDANQNRAQEVRAQAVERARQIRAQAAEKAPQMAQANRGKAMGALAFLLLVLWLRRRRNRRASRTGDGVTVALDQQARSVVDDTVTALSAEAASTGRAQDKTRKVRGRAAARTQQARAQAVKKAQQARAQAAERAQQVRAEAVERAQQLREQAVEKAQAAEKAQQLAQEAQQLVHALGQRLPRR